MCVHVYVCVHVLVHIYVCSWVYMGIEANGPYSPKSSTLFFFNSLSLGPGFIHLSRD